VSKLRKPRTIRRANTANHTTIPGMMAVAMGMVASSASFAETQSESEDSNIIEIVEVFGEKDAPYKARRSGDARRIADLLDSPNTMTILTQSQILDSGKTDLKEILSSQAGITLGTGENGNAFGDRYIIRGHEARSDVFVDGVRDPGMTTRESFATEQLEISKGPSSTFAGRGSSGGAVNGITKQASLDYDFSIAETSIGTENAYRVTFDTNQPLSDAVAFRANLLHADENVPNRDPAFRSRIGGLLSGLWQVNDSLDIVVDYYHLEANDVPDLGSYFDPTERKPVSNIPVYLQDSDFLDTDVDTFTVKVSYEFSDMLRFQNATRYGNTSNGYVTTGARGTTRDASDPEAPGASTFTLSTHQGWQEVDYFVTQSNLLWETEIGSTFNKLVLGVEYSNEDVQNGFYEVNSNGATNCVVSGRGGVQGSYCGLNGAGQPVASINTLLGRTIERAGADSNFDVATISLYVMDTVEVGENWTAFFGARFDRFHYKNEVVQRGTESEYDYSDGFWNGHVGLVRALSENGNAYFTYSTATNINGGESDVGGSCGYGGLCGSPEEVANSDPEHVENLELGIKWEFLDNRLLATAALFRVTKDDVMESVGDAYSTLGTLNTGRNRVEGIELSMTGAITDKLSTQLAVALMSSEVLDAFNLNNIGRALSNFADDSVYVQLRYQPTDNLVVGGAYTYKSEMYGGQPDTAAGYDTTIGNYSVVVPSYDVLDLFVHYYPTDNINLRVNFSNVTDAEYWQAAYRSGSFMYLGDARSVRGTVTWEF